MASSHPGPPLVGAGNPWKKCCHAPTEYSEKILSCGCQPDTKKPCKDKWNPKLGKFKSQVDQDSAVRPTDSSTDAQTEMATDKEEDGEASLLTPSPAKTRNKTDKESKRQAAEKEKMKRVRAGKKRKAEEMEASYRAEMVAEVEERLTREIEMKDKKIATMSEKLHSKKHAYRSEKRRLETAVAHSENENKKLKREVAIVAEEGKKTLEEKLIAKEREVTQERRKERKEHQEKIATLDAEKDELRKLECVAKSEAKIKSYEDQLRQERSAKREAQQEKDAAVQEKSVLEQQLQVLSKQLDSVAANYNRQKSRAVKQVEGENKRMKRTIGQLKAFLAKMENDTTQDIEWKEGHKVLVDYEGEHEEDEEEESASEEEEEESASEEEEIDDDDSSASDPDEFYVEVGKKRQRHISRNSRRRYVRKHIRLLHKQADGHIDTAVQLMKDLLNSQSPAFRPVAEKLSLQTSKATREKASIAECTFANVRRVASIARSRNFDKESSISHQVVGSILGPIGKKGTKVRKLIKELSGYGDKALDGGAKRWEKIGDGGLLYEKNKKAYRNKLEVKHPGITAYVQQGWHDCTQQSPNKGDEALYHAKGEGKHAWTTQEKNGKTRRIRTCIDRSDDITKVGEKCVTHQVHYKESNSINIMREWVEKTKDHPEYGKYAEVLKPHFFQANKPWYVKEPSFRTCVCPYHHGFQSACSDIAIANIWQKVHSECGGGIEKGCQSCQMCRDGTCKTFWTDVRKDDKVLLNQLLCPVDENGDYKYECLTKECTKCIFSKRENGSMTSLPECLSCPLMDEFMARKESTEDDSVDVDDGEKKIRMKLWVKKEQAHYDDKDWRERQYDAREVGGQEEEGGKRSTVKKMDVMEEKELLYKDVKEVMMARIDQYALHSHLSKHQSRAIKKCEATLKHGDVMLIADFGANIDHKHQDGRQSEHFSHYQTTILPVAIFRMVGTRRVLEGLIFVSDDTTHSNAFVQHCINKTIGRMDELTEGGLKNLHIWTDGCAQQFKSKYQMLWVADDRKNKEGQVIRIHHHFFASCHGKNLCDGMTGFIKSWIRREEERGKYMADTEALIPWLEGHVKRGEFKASKEGVGDDWMIESSEKGKGTFDAIDIVYVPFGEVDHSPRYESSRVEGIKKMHCFRSGDGPLELVMNALSCFCDVCLNEGDDGCSSKGKRRPEDVTITMVKTEFARRSFSDGWEEFFKRGLKITQHARFLKGKYVVIYAPPSWTPNGCLRNVDIRCSGRFMLAEIAQVPTSTKRVRGTKSRPREGGLVKMFLPQERKMYEHYWFPSQESCRSADGELVERGRCKEKDCRKKHYEDISLDHIRHGPIELVDLLKVNRDVICVDSDEESDEEDGLQANNLKDNSPGASASDGGIDLFVSAGLRQIVDQQWRRDEQLYDRVFTDGDHTEQSLNLAGRRPRKTKKK